MNFIIILNYNNASDTILCVESVLENNLKDISILIIDNASTDNSILNLQNWLTSSGLDIANIHYRNFSFVCEQNIKQSSKISFITVDTNNGYASGNNIGIAYVIKYLSQNNDFIWILNNDTLIQANTLENLINCYKILEKENIALLGSKILNEDLSLQSIGHLNKKCTEDEIMSQSNIEVEHISGCSVFFRVDKIKEIGFLPEEYFLYYEETDWMKSIKQKGFKIFTCLSSQLIHKHAKSTGGIYSPFVIYYMTRNQILFNRKYLNSIQYYLFITKMISRNLLKIIFYSFKNLKSSKSIFTGTIDGILNKKGKKEF